MRVTREHAKWHTFWCNHSLRVYPTLWQCAIQWVAGVSHLVNPRNTTPVTYTLHCFALTHSHSHSHSHTRPRADGGAL